jgi:hypothetical protein
LTRQARNAVPIVTAATVPADIVASTRDVALGDGWFPLESYRGQQFRWAENDVTVNVAVLDSVQTLLVLVVEVGPGLGGNPLELTARLDDGTSLGTVKIKTKGPASFPLPPDSPRAYRVTLSVRGGGKKTGYNDPRILNFRAFSVNLERRVDVLPAWAVPGKGFYVVEQLGDATYRWVSNDAEIALHETSPATLAFDVEPGPGVDSKPFALKVLDADGVTLQTADITSRTTVRVPTAGQAGKRIVLHVDGGGATVPNDPRIMNFRVFAEAR